MDADRLQRIVDKFAALAEEKRERAASVHAQYLRVRRRTPEQSLELLDLYDDLSYQASQIERILEGE